MDGSRHQSTGCRGAKRFDSMKKLLQAISLAEGDNTGVTPSFGAMGTLPPILPLLQVAVSQTPDATVPAPGGGGEPECGSSSVPSSSSAASINPSPAQLTSRHGRGSSSGKDTKLTVSLPIVPELAAALMAAGEHAQRGRGAATIVEAAVSDSQRILAKRLSFDNPAWARELERVVNDEVKKGLGVTASDVKAELRNLLIYSKGGHRSRLRDGKKCPGMFGTLVVSLPCIHQGGTLIMQHCGEEHRFETATSNPCRIQWCAFFADVQHEVQPIESGYRVVLVYNLIRVGRGILPKPRPSPVHAMKEIAHRWRCQEGIVAVHMLKHAYGKHGIKWDELKGADARVVSALRTSGEFDLQLAIVTMTEECGASFPDYYDYIEWQENGCVDVDVEETYIEIKGSSKFLADGLPNIQRVEDETDLYDFGEDQVEAQYFLQGEDFFSDREPTDTEIIGPNIHEEIEITRWKTAAAVIIRPKRLRLAAFGFDKCRESLVNAVNGDRDSLLGFSTPQLLYDNWVAAEGGVSSFCSLRSTDAINDILCALSHPTKSLSAKCARDFLHTVPSFKISKSLCSGLQAVVRRHWDSNGGWVQKELLEMFARLIGAEVSEGAVVSACDFMIALFSSNPTLPGVETSVSWTALHEEAARIVVSTLARSVPAATRRVRAVTWPSSSVSPAQTIVAVVSALSAPSNPVSIQSQLSKAASLITCNTARFHPFGVLPDALELLGATSPLPKKPTKMKSEFAGSEDYRLQFCNTLINSVVKSIATRSAQTSDPCNRIANALRCAIKADAVDCWTPLAKRFEPKCLISALANLFTSSSWEGRSVCLSKFWTTWSQCLCDLTVILLNVRTTQSSGWILQLFKIAMVLDTAGSKADTTMQLARQVVVKRPVQPFIINLVKEIVSPPSGKQFISPGVVHLVRHCTNDINKRLNAIPALPQRHVNALKKLEAISLSSCEAKVQSFFRSANRSQVFCGRMYTYNCAHTCALQRLGDRTGLFTIEMLSSKSARVIGRLRVTKTLALLEALPAQDSRRKKVNPLECTKQLLQRLTQKLPPVHRSGMAGSSAKRSHSTTSLPSSIVKRVKSESSASQSPHPGRKVEPEP